MLDRTNGWSAFVVGNSVYKNRYARRTCICAKCWQFVVTVVVVVVELNDCCIIGSGHVCLWHATQGTWKYKDFYVPFQQYRHLNFVYENIYSLHRRRPFWIPNKLCIRNDRNSDIISRVADWLSSLELEKNNFRKSVEVLESPGINFLNLQLCQH